MRLLSARIPVLCSLVLAGPLAAQTIPFSQRGAVQQTVGFTEFTIRYGRPVARGRVLFGDSAVVKWNQIWHPGADSATTITFDHDIQFEGRPVAAGAYTIWLVPRATAPWTVILSRAVGVQHTPYPGESLDVMRVDVTPERGAHMETLAYYSPLVLRDDAVLRMHWGEVIVPMRIKALYRPG